MDRVTEYAKKIINKEIPSGRLHYLACKRHLTDLEKQNTDEFPYYWDEEKANDILNYAETLSVIDGGKHHPIKLIDSQVFDIGCTFGWYKTVNKKRRFRRRYKSVARQQGKSFENGIMGTYIGGFGEYLYQRLFTVATKKRQAKIAWDEMAKFIRLDPDLEYDKIDNPEGFFEVKEYNTTIKCKKTNCTIEALSREAGLEDGFNSVFSSIDEIHQHKDNKIYKAIYNGTRSLDETLVSMITTRGDDLNSFCKEMDDYCISILEGTSTADDFFVDIYSLDEGDDIWDERNWFKANPFTTSKGNESKLEILKSDAQTAKDMGGADLRDFMTKSLNMWVENTDDMFIDTEKWKECGTNRTLEDFKNKSCYVGLDLSSGGDLTSFALEFVDNYINSKGENKEKIYFHSHSFMPRGRMQEHIASDLAPYDLWEQKELITITGGAGDYKNDYGFIVKELKRLRDTYNISFLGIGYDPHNADGFLKDLEELGCPLIQITQSARALNDATVDVQLMVKSNDIEYNKNNELLTWSFKNARVVRNSFDEIKVDKKEGKNFKRIDPVDACIDAHACKLALHKTSAVDIEGTLSTYLQILKGGK